MEGLADEALREILTGVGGFDLAVAGFVRVSQTVLPARSFVRVCPELARGGRTRAGTPVAVQLLGADAELLAANARRLARLAPPAIDLNFGCPSPAVTSGGAGAVLLDEPPVLERIVRAVRQAVPADLSVTAKMRLGTHDASRAVECALAIEAGGACEIVVHARTLADGYRSPARWEWIARVRQAVRVKVVANGEIWTAADHARCRELTGCTDVMLGRGAAADPFLARRIVAAQAGDSPFAPGWAELAPWVARYWRMVRGRLAANPAAGRLKYWLSWLRRGYAEAAALAAAVRTVGDDAGIAAALAAHGVREAVDSRDPTASHS